MTRGSRAQFVNHWPHRLEWRSVATTTDTPAPGPVRTCVGCRAKAAASELLRVVAGSDAEGRPALVPDPDRRAPGRGAHLHPTTECYELAVRRKAFGRALRVQAGSVPGGLDSTAVGEYVAARARAQHEQ